MPYDFDQFVERRHTESLKWHHYGKDVLPLCVADMDFMSAEPVIRALHERVEHGIFGYGARVAVSDGAIFGRGGERFVRLNFGCPSSILAEALDRMREALSAL